ncbi:hypothetical protein PCYB_121340 [Plasmodium cynomolgi strain B]|uniref:Uncharacterized protein n=1 Tax=Plasmodium cynomolgi (strain B) TaxID=1120755 RepID=K6UE16_PLACD|nr:hypothetical protein PCYB_121340 [Plasmodium cynomolgi strain B]GAB67566.1 hypothetical protein PCYB_121340 [Plasmodium cynomolgi strain B]
MDELWGFSSNSGYEKEDIRKGDGDGVVTPSEESAVEANGEWGGKKMNHEDAYVGRDGYPICESRNDRSSGENYSDEEDTAPTGKKIVGNRRKRKKGKNHPNEDQELTLQNEKKDFYPRNDKKRKKEEGRQKTAKGTNRREDEEEATPTWRKPPHSKGTEANALNDKLNGWDNPSDGVSKRRTKKHTPDETTRLRRKNNFKEKMEAKKEFMNVVHEIRKLTLPHLDKFQKKIVENYQVKMLGGKFDKSPKVHYPELIFRKKSMKRYIQQRIERERMMGVKTQSGNYIDMQDVNRRKKKMMKEKTSLKLF